MTTTPAEGPILLRFESRAELAVSLAQCDEVFDAAPVADYLIREHSAPATPDLGALRAMEERKDAAYLERNRCVALIARMAVAMGLPVAVTKTAIEGWSEDWHGCIYIGLPTGQVSWHFHDSQAHLFDGLPIRPEAWDGHDTPEKYRRVDAAFAAGQAAQVAPVGLTDAEIASACLSYRHDFGLLPDDQRRALMAQAREWDRALQKERAHGIPAPRADDKGEPT